MCFCSLCFFSLPLIFNVEADRILHLPTAVIKCLFFFQGNSSPLLIISCSSSFSVIHVIAHIKIYSKKRLDIVAVFSFTPGFIKGWTYLRTGDFARSKVSLMHR